MTCTQCMSACISHMHNAGVIILMTSAVTMRNSSVVEHRLNHCAILWLVQPKGWGSWLIWDSGGTPHWQWLSYSQEIFQVLWHQPPWEWNRCLSGGGSMILGTGPKILFLIMIHLVVILFTTPSLSWRKACVRGHPISHFCHSRFHPTSRLELCSHFWTPLCPQVGTLLHLTRATQWSACADWWTEGCSSWCKEVLLQRKGCTHERAQPGKGPWARAQGPKELFANQSECLNTTANNIGDSRTKSQVVIPTWSLPQPEAGPSWLPPPRPEARPSRLPLSQKEMRPASPPKEVNLGSHITMEVDNEYEWMEEAGYKLVDGPLPVSKRQQRKGLGPSVYILAFNSVEALEKNYLAQSPSHSLTDPALHWEREGVLNRITVDKLAMKNRPSGPALSIELPPPGEPSVGFPWRPVPEHLVNLLGIGEPLTVGDPPLSQIGQLPRPLGWTSLRKAQWFDLCPMTDPIFKETVEVMKEITPAWRMWDMHAIMQWLHEACCDNC